MGQLPSVFTELGDFAAMPSHTASDLVRQNRVLKVADLGPARPLSNPKPYAQKRTVHLTVIRDGLRAESFPLEDDVITVGRKSDNNFSIPDKCVSGHHANLRRLTTGDYEIADLESFNGTIVNGRRVKTAILRAGDHILFGTTEAVLETRVSQEEAEKWAEVFQEYQEECGLLERQRDALTKEADLNRSRVEHLKTERVRVLKECDQVQQRLESDRSELVHTKKELIHTNERLERVIKDLRAAEDEREELKRFKQNRAMLDAELESKREELHHLQRSIEQSRKEQKKVEEICETIASRRTELSELTLEIEEAQQERDRLNKESEEFQRILGGFDAIEKQREEEMTQMEGRLLRKKAELEFYENRIEQASKERDQLFDETRDFRNILTNFEQRKLQMASEERKLEAKLKARRALLGETPERDSEPALEIVEDEVKLESDTQSKPATNIDPPVSAQPLRPEIDRIIDELAGLTDGPKEESEPASPKPLPIAPKLPQSKKGSQS